MDPTGKTKITVEASIKAPIDKVWQCWTEPRHITQWNFASSEWHSPTAKNDLKVNGKFVYRMESRDGSFGFDFSGVFDRIDLKKHIEYTLDDTRKVEIFFSQEGDHIIVKETFEAESENSVDLQRTGWQAILDNFKEYVENVKLT